MRGLWECASVNYACWTTCQHYSHSLLVHGRCSHYQQAFSIAAFICSSSPAVTLLQVLGKSKEQLLQHHTLFTQQRSSVKSSDTRDTRWKIWACLKFITVFLFAFFVATAGLKVWRLSCCIIITFYGSCVSKQLIICTFNITSNLCLCDIHTTLTLFLISANTWGKYVSPWLLKPPLYSPDVWCLVLKFV